MARVNRRPVHPPRVRLRPGSPLRPVPNSVRSRAGHPAGGHSTGLRVPAQLEPGLR